MKTNVSSLVLGFICVAVVDAQEPVAQPVDEEAEHAALRLLRDEAVAALNQGDVDALLEYVHLDVVMTAPSFDSDGTVSRGHDGVRAYYDKMMTGPDRRANSVKIQLNVDETSIIHGGDTAIAWGSSLDTYDMVDGSEFTIATRWSATLVKQDGRWLIAECHISADMFDNPVLTIAVQRTMLISGLVAGFAGLLVGVIGGFVLRSRRGKV